MTAQLPSFLPSFLLPLLFPAFLSPYFLLRFVCKGWQTASYVLKLLLFICKMIRKSHRWFQNRCIARIIKARNYCTSWRTYSTKRYSLAMPRILLFPLSQQSLSSISFYSSFILFTKSLSYLHSYEGIAPVVCSNIFQSHRHTHTLSS